MTRVLLFHINVRSYNNLIILKTRNIISTATNLDKNMISIISIQYYYIRLFWQYVRRLFRKKYPQEIVFEKKHIENFNKQQEKVLYNLLVMEAKAPFEYRFRRNGIVTDDED